MPSLATVLKRVYLWNWNSYEAGSGLILEVINCTLTWNNKQEIGGQCEVVPILRSYHIYIYTYTPAARAALMRACAHTHTHTLTHMLTHTHTHILGVAITQVQTS